MRLAFPLLLASAASAQTLPARHDHWRGSCSGELAFDDQGVVYQTPKKGHSWRLAYLDIQQLRVLDNGEVRVLTYQDRKWRLGADREYRLFVTGRPSEKRLEELLGRRFVSGLGDAPAELLWQIPAKHLRRFSGSEGVLIAAEDRVVYRTARPGESRSWMLSDIDNINASDPFQLTITTFERARGHYGDRKAFHFRLKQPLDPARFQRLWRRLEQSKGLQILTLSQEKLYDR